MDMNFAVAITAYGEINLPLHHSGRKKEIVAYNFSGRVLKKCITSDRTLSLQKDLGLSAGMYIIKTTVLR
jgi:hypothetical protein